MPEFRYFWFLCAAWMAVSILIWRHRLRIAVARGAVNQDETDRFVRAAVVGLIGVPALLGLIALAAGWSSPFCAGVLEFDTLPRALTSSVLVFAWLALLAWIWRGDGANLLVRIGLALSKEPEGDPTRSARTIRRVVTAPVLYSAVTGAVGWRLIPQSPLICPATLPAQLTSTAARTPSAAIERALNPARELRIQSIRGLGLEVHSGIH